ncbi:MAG TPA: FeoA family protein [Pirellulales bacterium]|nr:FeoA family protein [Pirellulales bacterium]
MTEAPYELIPLGQLSTGRKAVVAAVLGGPEQVHRLHELGLRDGAAVEMVRTGSPCILRLGSQKLCFRADEMVSVLVKPGAGG